MMTMSRNLAIGLLVVCIGLAAAPARAADFEAPPSQPSGDDGKSPAVAAALSAGAALVGYGTAIALITGNDGDPFPLFMAGAVLGVVGPAAGHIYGGHNGTHAVLFALGRVGFIALAFAGISDLIKHDDGETGPASKGTDYTLIWTGAIGVAGLTIWEVVDSYSCAKIAEPSHPTSSRLAVSPFLAPGRSGAGAGSGGLLLSGRF